DILSCFARKPLFGYKPMVYSISAIAGLGFVVWGHHMFISGMNPALGMTFMVSTMMIALPSAIKTFNWIGTIWGGNIRFNTVLLNCVAFVSMFIVGGLSGIFMAAVPVDIYFHDTYFIVAHFHYILFGSTLFGVFAAIFYWFPKMFGRMMNETLGKIHFWGTIIPFNLIFIPLFVLGAAGQHRRIYDYTGFPELAKYQDVRVFATMALLVMLAFQLVFFYNCLISWRSGKKAGNNPWNSNTLEWTTSSPPGHGNWKELPTVYRGPYEYSTPGREEDFWPQNVPN
ncbi:MAG: cbb3-type cytochrome c oxidase subunit I, partial [Myxococcales bacterium]|nr:cbb3-type cytochrome c oxidase subunit I [Myxococcales bacterium]